MSNPNEINFKMVAVTKVEADGVEYAPGESFTVVGIDRVRWLQGQGAAVPESSAEAAPVEDGGQNPQPQPVEPASAGTPNESTHKPQASRRQQG